jgi:hypothetical protein
MYIILLNIIFLKSIVNNYNYSIYTSFFCTIVRWGSASFASPDEPPLVECCIFLNLLNIDNTVIICFTVSVTPQTVHWAGSSLAIRIRYLWVSLVWPIRRRFIMIFSLLLRFGFCQFRIVFFISLSLVRCLDQCVCHFISDLFLIWILMSSYITILMLETV